MKAEDGNKPVAKADLAVQTAWTKFRDEMKVHKKAVSDAQRRSSATRKRSLS